MIEFCVFLYFLQCLFIHSRTGILTTRWCSNGMCVNGLIDMRFATAKRIYYRPTRSNGWNKTDYKRELQRASRSRWDHCCRYSSVVFVIRSAGAVSSRLRWVMYALRVHSWSCLARLFIHWICSRAFAGCQRSEWCALCTFEHVYISLLAWCMECVFLVIAFGGWMQFDYAKPHIYRLLVRYSADFEKKKRIMENPLIESLPPKAWK